MAFDGVPIGIGDGLPEGRRWCLDRSWVSGCPGLEKALGAVEMVLVPSDRKYFDPPACLPQLVPQLPVGLAPGMEQASGGHARIYVGEDGPVNGDGHEHLDVEIADAAIGAAGLDSFWKQLGVNPELLEAGDFLRRLQPSNCNSLIIIDLLRLNLLHSHH